MTEHRSLDQIFQNCLDLLLTGQKTVDQVVGQYPELADELRPELEVVIWLREKGRSLEPRPGFLTASRSRLMQQIHQETFTGQSRVSSWGQFWRHLSSQLAWQAGAALLVLLSLLFMSSQTINATRNAIPGQALYPLKLLVEKTRLSLAPNDYQAAQLYVDFSLRRQNEIEELIFEGHYELLPDAIQAYQKEVAQALQSLDHLASSDPKGAQVLATTMNMALSSQVASLTVLSTVVPTEYSQPFDQMMQFNVTSAAQVETLLNGTINPALGIATSTSVIFSPTFTRSNPTSTLKSTDHATSSPTPTELIVLPVATEIPTLITAPSFTPTFTITVPVSTATPSSHEDDDGKPDTHTPKPPNPNKPPTHTPKPPKK
jgi:hypothetical protein